MRPFWAHFAFKSVLLDTTFAKIESEIGQKYGFLDFLHIFCMNFTAYLKDQIAVVVAISNFI